MSKVAVIGAGYVGLTTAACLADLGNQVTVVDVDHEKIALLRRNQVPFYEPGIQELVERNAKARRLAFTTSYADAVPGAEYAIIAVSTPEGEGGEADLSYVEAAASSIADAMDGPLVVVNKSTVPPLTGDMVSAVLKRRNGEFAATVVSNPEFLREGSAIQDFMHPDRIVVGSHDRDAAEKVAVMDINRDQRMLVIDKLRECLEELPAKVIGLLGLAFKPNTDDMREAPSVDIAKVLLAAGAEVRAYDPAAMERSRTLLPDVEYLKDAYQVASGADALVLVTEWNEFRQLDMARVKQLMRRPVIIDGRNIYDPAVMRSLGFTYRGVGRE